MRKEPCENRRRQEPYPFCDKVCQGIPYPGFQGFNIVTPAHCQHYTLSAFTVYFLSNLIHLIQPAVRLTIMIMKILYHLKIFFRVDVQN